MSCDIHSFAEVKNKSNGSWEMVDTDMFSLYDSDKFYLDAYDKESTKKEKNKHPFYWQDYSMFGFLAGVTNYDCCEPLSKPKGVPNDVSNEIHYEWCEDKSVIPVHSTSFLTLRELIEFDYEKTFWNRRIERQISPTDFDCAATAEEGEGKIISYKENLGEMFFIHLEELKKLGDLDDVRIVFWFDN